MRIYMCTQAHVSWCAHGVKGMSMWVLGMKLRLLNLASANALTKWSILPALFNAGTHTESSLAWNSPCSLGYPLPYNNSVLAPFPPHSCPNAKTTDMSHHAQILPEQVNKAEGQQVLRESQLFYPRQTTWEWSLEPIKEQRLTTLFYDLHGSTTAHVCPYLCTHTCARAHTYTIF